MLYLYAVAAQSVALPSDLSGFDGTPVIGIVEHDLVAAVSPLAATVPLVTTANVYHHEAVLERLMAAGPILPMRFGTALPNEGQVRSLLSAHYPRLVDALARVRGRVELGLRVFWDEPVAGGGRNDATGPPSSNGSRQVATDASSSDRVGNPHRGLTYLSMRREEERQALVWQQRAEELALAIHAPLSALAVESTRQILGTAHTPLSAAYLVEPELIVAFQQAVQEMAIRFPTVRLLCTGPWPPYNFVTECVSRMPLDGASFIAPAPHRAGRRWGDKESHNGRR